MKRLLLSTALTLALTGTAAFAQQAQPTLPQSSTPHAAGHHRGHHKPNPQQQAEFISKKLNLSADALEQLLNRQCGLFAFSNDESDMQALLAREAANDSTATLAIDAFATAARKTIGAYAALLGGLDLLVFTGGIGQHSAPIRARICQNLAFLGLDADSSNPRKVLALPSQEELQIARHTRVLLGT